jgi:AcrR family transcriptional regulator
MPAVTRREHLLDAARDIAVADGFPALTIERVAAQADVSRTLIYQQFGDLAGLITALLDRESMTAMAGMNSVDRPQSGQGNDLAQVGRDIVNYLHAAPTSWRLILSPHAGAFPELRDRIELGRSYARSVAARHIARTVGHRVAPDSITIRTLLAAMEELGRLHLNDPQRYPDTLVLQHFQSLATWATDELARHPRTTRPRARRTCQQNRWQPAGENG